MAEYIDLLEPKQKKRSSKKAAKPAPIEEPAAPVQEEEKEETPASKEKKGINALCAHRGMSDKINNMIAMGSYTVDEIIACIRDDTRNKSDVAARKKLMYHLANMSHNGGNIYLFEGKYVQCREIFFPD